MSWRIEITAAARADIERVLDETLDEFGERKHDEYQGLLRESLNDLAADPYSPRSKSLDKIRPGIRTLHIARRGRHARHLLAYRVTGDAAVEVIRLLHDAMDLPRHLRG